MKKIHIVSIILLLVCLLSACGNNKQTINETTSITEEAQSETNTIPVETKIEIPTETTEPIIIESKELDIVGAMFTDGNIVPWEDLDSYEELYGYNSSLITDEIIGKQAFMSCKDLVAIKLPETIKEIGNSTFKDCTNLRMIDLDEDLEIIDESAFSGCRNLPEIKLPKMISYISEDCFSDCNNLIKVTFNAALLCIKSSAFANSKIESVELPEGLTKIENGAFENCTALQKVILPSTLTEIQDNAFSGCSSLDEINVPDSVSQVGDEIFKGCTNLKNIALGTGLNAITEMMFSECQSLETIEIPDNIKIVESDAFARCEKLSEIKLSAYIEEVGYAAFPSSVESIKYQSMEYTETKALFDAFDNNNVTYAANCWKISEIAPPETSAPEEDEETEPTDIVNYDPIVITTKST